MPTILYFDPLPHSHPTFDMAGDVFIIQDKVRCRIGRVVDFQGDVILVLVDADNEKCTPHPYLLDVSNLRVLLTSPPRPKNDRRWLTQSVRDRRTVFVMVTGRIHCCIVRLFWLDY